MFDLFGNTTTAQNSLEFPTSLTERYRPRTMSAFVGLAKPKALCAKLAANPFPSAWLFVGPSGTGKTTMAMALGEQVTERILTQLEAGIIPWRKEWKTNGASNKTMLMSAAQKAQRSADRIANRDAAPAGNEAVAA